VASLEKVFRSIRFAGIPNVIGALHYARFKSRLDRLHPSRQLGALPSRSPGGLLNSQLQPAGGEFQFERANLEILFLAPDLVRISWSPGIPPLPYALAGRMAYPEKAVPTSDEWLKTTGMQVRVCPDETSFQDVDSNRSTISCRQPLVAIEQMRQRR
jgi:hypothetical protein